MLNQPQAGGNETVVRRRTRRHRRNRLLRRASLLASVVVLGIGFSTIVLRHLSPSWFHVSRSTERGSQTFDPKQDLLLLTQQETLRQMENRPVYPYSIVPGGVRDAQELKWAADHDPVVRAHYAGFDYDHARGSLGSGAHGVCFISHRKQGLLDETQDQAKEGRDRTDRRQDHSAHALRQSRRGSSAAGEFFVGAAGRSVRRTRDALAWDGNTGSSGTVSVDVVEPERIDCAVERVQSSHGRTVDSHFSAASARRLRPWQEDDERRQEKRRTMRSWGRWWG